VWQLWSAERAAKFVLLSDKAWFSAIIIPSPFKAYWLRDAPRGGVRSTRGLGPTMTARDQTIGIPIGMLPQTLIMSRIDQLSQLDARI
jgi:hypothetical protein